MNDIKRLIKHHLPILDILALFAGAVLPLAFAPFNFFLLAVISPALLFYCWLDINYKRAYWRGFLFGVGQFGVGVSWVYVSIHVYGDTIPPLAVFLTLVFVVVLAQFPAWAGLLFARLFPKPTFLKIFAFPLLWVLMDWIRSWIFTGFPWLLLCYSQTNSPLRGYIPILGDHGVTFLLTLMSAFLIFIFLSSQRKLGPRLIFRNQAWIPAFAGMTIVMIVWLGGYYLSRIIWNKPLGNPIQVSLIQGNIPQELKWNPDHIKPTLDLYENLTNQHWDSKIIIWPEASVTLPMPYGKDFIDQLDKQAKQHHVALIVGVPVQAENQFYFYNAILSLGIGSGYYYKRHLVPFGEYVPLETWLRGLMTFFDLPMSNMIKGSYKQPLLQADSLTIAPFVCYEIAYAEDLYRALPKANILVTLSNDTWFGDSLAPIQHLQIGQYRAIQGARELLFCTNNGITAIVNSKGVIIKQIPQFQTAVLTGMIQPMTGRTPWSIIGDAPMIILIGSTFVIFWLIERRCKKLK